VVTLLCVGAAVATSVVAVDARAASAAALTPEQIKTQALAEARAQIGAQDYTRPASKPRWKVLFLGFSDVNFIDAKERDVMDANDRTYVQTVATNFEQVVEGVAPVDIVPTVKIDTEPLTVRQGDDTMLHEWSIGDRLKRAANLAEYDMISVYTKGVKGGVSFAGYYSDELTRGSAYVYSSVWAAGDEAAAYPKQSKPVQQTTEFTLHEFAHVFGNSDLGFDPYPDVHASSAHGYTSAVPFYLDLFAAKVPWQGKKYGTFPKMWSTSPRFLHNPATVRVSYQDSDGRTIAPSVNTYGPAGDPYAIEAPAIGGMKYVGTKAGSAPTGGTFSAATQPEVTLVYRESPVVTFSNGGTADANDTAPVRASGAGSSHYYQYRSDVPITRFSYTDELASRTNVSRLMSFLGMPFGWDSSGTAKLTKDGNQYTLQRMSETKVTVTVQLASPNPVFTLQSLNYVNTSPTPTGNAQEVFTLLNVTPSGGQAKDMAGKAPRAFVALAWDTLVSFSNGGTADAKDTAPVRAPGASSYHYYQYRSNNLITRYTYTDELASRTNVSRLMSFLGMPFGWDSSGTAKLTKDGNQYTLQRTSDTKVTVTVQLASPSQVFTLHSLNYVNTSPTPTGSAQEVFTLLNVTPSGGQAKDMAGKAPRAVVALSWRAG
jgi:hypothetical protein